MNKKLSKITEAIDAIKAGKMIILVDDEKRENEGDMVVAAEHVTPEAINFMIRHGGLVCLTMTEADKERLGLELIARRHASTSITPYFMTSFGAASGVSTGISAFDRATTIKKAQDPAMGPHDFVTPGHVFPLLAQKYGVFSRQGHTEASVDLMKLSGLKAMGVICEVMNPDGTMAKGDVLKGFADEHGLPMISVADITYYRIYHERLIREKAEALLPMHGRSGFTIQAFESIVDGSELIVLSKKPREREVAPLVRIHSECFTGDLLGSSRCDCGPQLERALDLIDREGGLIIYLRQEGRGIGLANKIRAYALQDKGLDTVEANIELGFEADLREYGYGAQILKYLELHAVRLLTNNPKKVEGIEEFGITVVERVGLEAEITDQNIGYLRTKRDKLGHLLTLEV